MINSNSYDEIMMELETVPENQDSEYMNAIYDSLHQMHQFTTQELDQNVDGEDIFELGVAEEPQHYDAVEDMLLYEIFIDTLEKSYGLKDFVKNVKRMKEFEDGHNQEIRQELADKALDEAEEAKEKYNTRPDEIAEDILEATDKVMSDMINDYEKVVESIIDPAIRGLD
ncbi:MAG: hypothetical protein BRC29_01825 [Nanohaloarchaea archaeon SW_7_43_1]|nr:MAG: hypothetical protein BRC29_01825 [Nanohaloarchaea archaeon SW_7_43_1]